MNRLHYHNFSFIPPEDWNDRSTILWVSPPRHDTTDGRKQELPRENFLIESQKKNPSDTDPVVYLQTLVDGLKHSLENFAVVEPVAPRSLSGCLGARVSYTLLVEEMVARQEHVVLFSGERVFHLVATASLSQYPQASPQFESMFNSFLLK